MTSIKLDASKLLGFRLIAGVTITAKNGTKVGQKAGSKTFIGAKLGTKVGGKVGLKRV